MGNKDKGRKEKKKKKKPKPKAPPAPRHEEFSQIATRLVKEATEKS